MTPEIKGFLLLGVIKILVVFTVLNVGVMMVIWLERRQSAFHQDRLGPNRVGPFGLLQSVADGIKNMMKEETYPAEANRTMFILAPTLSFIPSLLLFAVIPFAAPLPVAFDFSLPVLGRFTYDGLLPMMIADLSIGILFILAISSISVYGIVLAGWSSNSKYAFLGGLRASAQMISYEIALGLSVIAVLLLTGNVTLSEVVSKQQTGLWYVFPLLLGFVFFLISALAETNRLPFDLPEAESELVTGYHTEYSSMKFSMFFIGEYAAVITMSALIATLFFGGWDVPFTRWDSQDPTILKSVVTLLAFSAKTLLFIFVYIWIRWTLPRFRFDQLMAIGWKGLLPVTLGYLMLIATAVLVLDSLGIPDGRLYGFILFGVNIPAIYVLFWLGDRGRLIEGQKLRRPVVNR
ncbi:MAG: NADH-quinone oxidoreductase subunit NuoH [Gemmatimonadales bacterium]